MSTESRRKPFFRWSDDYFDGTSLPERVRRHFQVAGQLGAKDLRCTFSWNGIEKERGK